MNMTFSDLKRDTGGRLLIVDDEPLVRSMLVQAFSLLGYYTEEASVGEEVLALLKTRVYDVMILDLGLPDLNGVEVMRKACRIQPDLLTIVLTGNATLESAVAAIKLDAIDYLYKPVRINDVVMAVINALQKREEFREQFAQLVSEALDELHNPNVLSNSLPPDSDTPSTHPVIIVPPLQVDRANHLVRLTDDPDHTVDLTRGETAVLGSLMLYHDRPLSCQQLTRISWGYELGKEDAGSLIRPYIFRLRHKLETTPKHPHLILTIRRRGYQFASSEQK